MEGEIDLSSVFQKLKKKVSLKRLDQSESP